MYNRSIVHAAFHPLSTMVFNFEGGRDAVGKVILLESVHLMPHAPMHEQRLAQIQINQSNSVHLLEISCLCSDQICLQLLLVLLQCVDALGVDLAGKPPGRCLWQLPVQLLHTSWASKCGCHTTGTLTSGRMEVSLLSLLNQSIYVSCLWDSSGESTDNNWENNIHKALSV